MKNAIRYYYGLEVNQLDFYESRYYFDSYSLIPLQKSLDLSIYQLLQQYRYPLYEIVPNKDQEYITKIENQEYILVQTHEILPITFEVLEYFQIPIYQEEILPWHELWMTKIDFYEKYRNNVASSKLKNSFFYYEGLTENAISFYQEIKKVMPLYIAHSRMSDDFDYWNPTNFIIDYKARDIAEFTKNSFFNGNLNLSDLFLYRTGFQEQDYLLFYARMLFPSYYFDCFDKIIEGESDSCLDLFLDRVEAYESLLQELYFSFSRQFFLPKIDWLVDK